MGQLTSQDRQKVKMERRIEGLKEKEISYSQKIQRLEQSLEKMRKKVAEAQKKRAELEAQLAEHP